MSPPASWASTGSNHSWRPAAAWSSPPTSTRPTSRWPASTAWTRCGAGPISGGISCGPGPLTPRRSATGPMRGPSGSRCCTGRTTRWRPPHRAPTPASDAAGPLAAGLHRHRRAPHPAGQRRRKGPAAPGRRQGHRHAQQRMGRAGPAPGPAAAAAGQLSRCCRYAEVRAGRGCFRWPGRWPGRVVRHNHRASRNASSSSLAVYRPRRVRGAAVRSSARCLSSRSAWR